MRLKKRQPTKKDKDLAWKAIKDRELIVKKLDSLTGQWYTCMFDDYTDTSLTWIKKKTGSYYEFHRTGKIW